ncbi:MAG: ChrR family anti-sigma-E factor [Pseudomonadota bacterium]
MSIHHHPSDASLLAYAAGSMNESLSVLIATHIAMCPECRARVDEYEALGGEVLDAIAPAEMNGSGLDDVLGRLDDEDIEEEPVYAAPILDRARLEMPQPLRTYLPQGIDAVKWRPVGPGVAQFPIAGMDAKGARLRLLKIAPGVNIPQHSHAGQELTLILRGSYVDEIGRFAKGDVADLNPDVTHTPVADTDEDCICLVAADAPLKFNDIVSRIMQPFVGL